METVTRFCFLLLLVRIWFTVGEVVWLIIVVANSLVPLSTPLTTGTWHPYSLLLGHNETSKHLRYGCQVPVPRIVVDLDDDMLYLSMIGSCKLCTFLLVLYLNVKCVCVYSSVRLNNVPFPAIAIYVKVYCHLLLHWNKNKLVWWRKMSFDNVNKNVQFARPKFLL